MVDGRQMGMDDRLG